MAETILFWFRRRYSLTPNDPRVLDLTMEEIETDFWAHRYFDDPPKDEVVDDDFDLEALRNADPDEWEELVSLNGK